MNEVPVFTSVPPTAALYQLITAVSLAVRLIVPGPQRETSAATGEAVIALIVAVTLTLGLGQPPDACTK